MFAFLIFDVMREDDDKKMRTTSTTKSDEIFSKLL
jgi:hypothetical protein